MPKFSLTAIVSLNLALFNVLPLPILDGGIIAMLLFEGVRRKDISAMAKARLRTFALAAIAVFFVAALASDVSKLSFFASAAKHHKIVFWSLSAPVLAWFSYRARFAPWCRGIISSITSRIFMWRKDRISGNRHRAIAVTTDAHS